MTQFTSPPTKDDDLPSVRINLAELDDVKCDKCGDHRFELIYLVKRMSPLHPAAGGEERIIPLGPPIVPPIFACYNCGHVNDSFIPSPLRFRKKDDVIKTSLDILNGTEPPAGSSPDAERK